MVRRWLVVAAGLFAIGELIDGIVHRLPPGIVFGVVLAFCTWWAARSPGRAPAAVLGVLAAIEFLLVVFVYSRGEDPAAWWRLVLTVRCRWQSQSSPGSISPTLGGGCELNNNAPNRSKVTRRPASRVRIQLAAAD